MSRMFKFASSELSRFSGDDVPRTSSSGIDGGGGRRPSGVGEEEDEDDETYNWACCDRCQKWRRLPDGPEYAAEALPCSRLHTQSVVPVAITSKYRVPTMLDGPVVDTHIFAFESCAA